MGVVARSEFPRAAALRNNVIVPVLCGSLEVCGSCLAQGPNLTASRLKTSTAAGSTKQRTFDRVLLHHARAAWMVPALQVGNPTSLREDHECPLSNSQAVGQRPVNL